jgi:hypothetical protein
MCHLMYTKLSAGRRTYTSDIRDKGMLEKKKIAKLNWNAVHVRRHFAYILRWIPVSCLRKSHTKQSTGTIKCTRSPSVLMPDDALWWAILWFWFTEPFPAALGLQDYRHSSQTVTEQCGIALIFQPCTQGFLGQNHSKVAWHPDWSSVQFPSDHTEKWHDITTNRPWLFCTTQFPILHSPVFLTFNATESEIFTASFRKQRIQKPKKYTSTDVQPCGVSLKPLAVGNKISCVLFQCSHSRRNIL